MGATNFDGPLFSYGAMAALAAAFGDAVPDYDLDAGPSGFYQGVGLLDLRYPFLKDKVQGYTGVVPAQVIQSEILSVDAVPQALSATAIAAAQNVTNGTPMTLVAAQSLGISPGVPVVPNTGFGLNGGAVQNCVAIDFGFDTVTTANGNAQVTVGDSTLYALGMPLVIPGAGGNATTALLTNVTGIVDATHIDVGPNLPASVVTNGRVGTGNLWGPNPQSAAPVPTGAQAALAGGSGLLLDPRQAIARAVSITGVTGGTGGNFVVLGYDVFNQLMAEQIAVGAGAVTGNGKKAFKFILSVTPQFTDAHNYSVGTQDVYGFHVRADRWEYATVYWSGLQVVGASTGFTAPDKTNPATRATGDVRGTYAVQSASNGTNRLVLYATIPPANLLMASPAAAQTLYGATQAQ